MKKFSFLNATKTLSIILFSALIFISCDNSTGHDDDHEQEPVGLRVKLNGDTVSERTATGTTTGNLVLTVGNTSIFTVLFIDEDGDEFTPEVEEHSIVVTATGSQFTVATTNSDSTPFGFSLTGVTSGNSTVSITMNHEGAPEFGPILLPVVVVDN